MAGERKPITTFIVDCFVFFGRPLFFLLKIFLRLFWVFLTSLGQIFRFLGKTGQNLIKKKPLSDLKKPLSSFFDKTSFLKRWLKAVFSFFKNKIFSFFSALKGFFKKFFSFFRPRFLALVIFLSLFFYLGWSIFKDLPQPQKLITRDIKQTTRIYDQNGNLLYRIFRHQNRTLVPLEEIPLVVKEATIAIEDGNFYQHRGISFSGIGRSFWRLFSQGKIEGGSTITQQLVKNALLSPERTVSRKIKEIVLALMVEARFSKDEILQMYLNEVGYGGATYGVEEASQYYFGKSARELNLAEAALLAGLPASPTAYSPFGAQPQLAKNRQREVLFQMEKKGFITKEVSQRVQNAEIRLKNISQDILAPHFVMQVKQELVDIFGDRFVEEGGLQVTTTLDLPTQQMAQKVVKEELDKLTSFKVTNGAALVTNPKTGEILAMVGSRDYFDSDNDGNFNVTTAPRQPGSIIKVVNYALALQSGYTLASKILDAPVSFQIPGQPPYRPSNYDNRFHGPVTLRTALACSYNVPAVKVLASLGVDRMISLGQKMGITGWSDDSQFGLSLTLGGGEVTMKELATVYGVLANGGAKAPLQTIIKVHDHKGRLIWANPCLEEAKINPKTFAVRAKSNNTSCGEKVISSQIAWLLTSVLSDNQARSPVFGPNSIINIPQYQVAVKTGTTNNLRDNWTIGYSPNLLVVAWVGNNDNSPMAKIASGVTGASPIWRRIMETLLVQEGAEEFLVPEGIVSRQVCLSWSEEEKSCQEVKEEYFVDGEQEKKGFGQIADETETRDKLLPAQQDSRR
jgi:1A family penicillin-binding protein